MPQIVMNIGDGERFAPAVMQYLRRKYALVIGVHAAERIFDGIGSAMPSQEDTRMVVQGRDLLTGLERTVTISTYEITEALTEPLEVIIAEVRKSLQAMPEEIISRAIDEGIRITGRAATLRTIDVLLTVVTAVNFFVSDDTRSA